MQQRPFYLAIATIAAFSWLPLSAQTLTPQELTQIHQMTDPEQELSVFQK